MRSVAFRESAASLPPFAGTIAPLVYGCTDARVHNVLDVEQMLPVITQLLSHAHALPIGWTLARGRRGCGLSRLVLRILASQLTGLRTRLLRYGKAPACRKRKQKHFHCH